MAEQDQRSVKPALLRRARRVVVKVGSAVLADSRGLRPDVIQRLACEIAACHRAGLQMTVVTSGAIAAGRAVLGMSAPRSIPERQAAAAVGQIALMAEYRNAFAAEKLTVAQILLDAADLADRGRFLNAEHCLASLHAQKIVPVVNENDTVAVEELKFGDNDNLSALVATLVAADLLVILSDVAGLFDENPRVRADAKRIPLVERVDAETLALADGAGPSKGFGTGGMTSKLLAARKAAAAGVATVIADGRAAGSLAQVLDPSLDIGTLFLPDPSRLARRKHWIAFTTKPAGTLICDDGAVAAVQVRGRSLLPSGIASVSGRFAAGACVRLVSATGEEFARGLASYGSQEIEHIAGKRSGDVERILGYKMGDEVVHRDKLVLLGSDDTRRRSKQDRAPERQVP